MKRRTQILAVLLAAALVVPMTTPAAVYAQDPIGGAEATQSSYAQLGADAQFEGNFVYDSGLNVGATGVFADTGKTVAGSDRMLKDDESVTIRIEDGFKYYDGTTYDILIEVTNTSGKEYGGSWECSVAGGYLTMSPSRVGDTSFNYEVWLEKDGKREKEIDLVAGSCFTASSEGARPYGDNGYIYTNIDVSHMKWDTKYQCWTPSDDDNASKYILGHGKTSDNSVKGGYVRKSGGGGAEIVIGYLVKTITFQNEDGAMAADLSVKTQKTAQGKNVIFPTTTPNTGYYLYSWTANKEVTLTNGTTIPAGDKITPAQLDQVVANDNISFTAHYKSYTVATQTDESDNTQKLVIKDADGEILTTMDVTAKAGSYDGNTYNANDKVKESGLDEVKKYFPDAEVTKTEYVVANEDGSVSDTATTKDNSGAETGGAAPKDAGTYYIKETITVNGETKVIYTKFVIDPKVISVSFTAADKTYDGTTNATLTGQNVTTGVEDEEFTITGCTGTFALKDAGVQTVNVDSSQAKATPTGNAKEKNYSIQYEKTTTATISQKEITVDVTAKDKVYDGNKTAVVETKETPVKTGVGDEALTITGLTGTFETSASGKDVKVTVDASNAVVTGVGTANKDNYKISYQPTTTTANITKKEAEAPINLTPTKETIEDKADGKIANLTTDMEYSLDGKTWIPVKDTTADFAAGTYKIRYAEKDNYKASPAVEVTVEPGDPLNIKTEAKDGCTLTTDKIKTSWKGETVITFTLTEGYTMTDDFAITVNGTEKITADMLTKTGENTYTYTLTDIQVDKTITAEGVRDTTPPTGEISVANNTWKSVLNTVTFGRFFKDSKIVTINPTDAESGSKLDTIEYYVSEKPLTQDEIIAIDTWTAYNDEKQFTLDANSINVVYAKLTDKAGNTAYLSSDGIVIYTDAEQDTADVTYTKTTGEDQTAKVELNGNTIKEVKLGDTVLKEGEDYTLTKDGTITFKGSWLQTLKASDENYTVTISYNPLGLEYVDGEENEGDQNQAPADTTISLKVQKAKGTASITNLDKMNKTYDSKEALKADVEALSTGKQTVYYRLKGASDDAWTTTVPTAAGTYEVKAVAAEDDNYTEATATGEFTIKAAPTTPDQKNTSDKKADADKTAKKDSAVKAESKKSAKAVKTGDNAQAAGYGEMAALAGIAAAAAALFRRKKRQ